MGFGILRPGQFGWSRIKAFTTMCLICSRVAREENEFDVLFFDVVSLDGGNSNTLSLSSSIIVSLLSCASVALWEEDIVSHVVHL